MTTFKSNLTEAQQRVEAWWRGEYTGRPILQLTAPRGEAPPYSGPRTDDMDAWWTDPAYVLPRLEHELRSTYYAAESMPVVFPVSTRIVSIMTRYLGAPNIYIDHNTTWAQPVIDDWSRPPALTFDPDNEWWRRSEELLSAAVEMIETQGYSAFVGLPDLNGPTEVLSGLRNPEKLAMDFYDQPEVIKPAIRKVQDAWFEAYRRSSAITSRSGGYISWLRVWSERPMCDLQSDVSCLISKEMFDQYFLPFIAEQARTIERTIYHLDGPDAVRHLDSLLTIEELDGIQWVPGAGAARMSEWIYLLKRIQDRGKLLHISCDPDEVPLLCRKLDPSRLVLQIHSESEEHADSLVRDAEQASS